MRYFMMIAAPLVFIAGANATAGDTLDIRVERGDTLQKISMKYYGTTRRWQEIFKLNRNHLSNRDLLAVGMLLKIKASADTIASTDSAPATARGVEETQVKVMPGDTLQKISMKHFGTTRKWKNIFDWNRNVLGNKDIVEVGTVLRLRPVLLAKSVKKMTPVVYPADEDESNATTPEPLHATPQAIENTKVADSGPGAAPAKNAYTELVF